MQFKNIGFGVRGLYAVASLALREANMSAIAEQRRDALAFWENHGLAAAMDYADVSRSTAAMAHAGVCRAETGVSGRLDGCGG